MAKQNISDADLNRILESLNSLKKAEPAPFLYTRIQARLSGTEDTFLQKLVYFVTRPAFAMSTGILILLLNGYFLFNTLQDKEIQQEESTQMLAVEYSSLNAPFDETTDEAP